MALDLSEKRRLASITAWFADNLGLTDAYGLVRKQITKSQVVILTYHRVGDPGEFPWNVPLVSTEDFEAQISYLSKSYKIMPLEVLAELIRRGAPLPLRAVAITFDDGYKNNFTHAYPILKKYCVPAFINLVTAHIGAGNMFWWDKIKYALWHTGLRRIGLGELGEYSLHSAKDRVRNAYAINQKLKHKPEEKRKAAIDSIVQASGVTIPAELGQKLVLSWDEVKEMSENSISFGAHTRTHPMLTKLSVEEAQREIAQSKKDIEEKLDREVSVFCYPNGDCDRKIIDIVKEAGYGCGLATHPGMVDSKANLYELPRISGGWDIKTLKLLSCGVYADFNSMCCRLLRGKCAA